MSALSMTSVVFSIVLKLTLATLSTVAAAATSNGNSTDRLALLALKAKITHDPHNSMKSWNKSVHFCSWEGVICSRKHQRVTVLNLPSKGFVGSLSPYIGNLSFLRQLTLQNNSLKGEIPQEIGRLFRLQVLRLENNSFEGEIPSNLSHCSNIFFLGMGYNKLVGKIPDELSTLSKLIQFSVIENYLSRGIPPSFGNLSSLEVFAANGNSLTGTIPGSFGKLQKLAHLALRGNRLSGIIPSAIYNISSLVFFFVSNNRLHGSIPPRIGLQLPQLQELEMWGNHFNGSIPISLSNASKLEYVDLGTNQFTGKILSAHFGGLKHLSHLALYQNNLGSNGSDDLNFITSLLNSTNFVFLDLSSNQLEGMLPNSVANLSSPLQWLSLGVNRIYGVLPPWLTTLVTLSRMSIQFNQITGPIPSDIGKLQNLYSMFFDHNKLSGTIPDSIGNLSILYLLHLNQNEMHGTVPSSLGNCHQLVYIDLSKNNFSGFISGQLFAVSNNLVSLDLSQNQLVGSLPSEIGNLIHINELIVTKNKLFGNISDDLSRCSSLEFLRMDHNNFQGAIPASFETLKGLRELDLSRNNLSGRIPDYFQNFALEYFNLSFNDFEGEVPTTGVFANASVIAVEGNKLCGGVKQLKLPSCISSKSDRIKRIAISISSVLAAALMLTLLYWFRYHKREAVSDALEMKQFLEISYSSILKATNGFSFNNLIGVGSFGSVYKANFQQYESVFAIKVLNLQRQGASKSFIAECEALKNIRHRNLVKIVSSCSSIDFQGNDFKALVYEYMPMGNLETWLHPSSEHKSLSHPSSEHKGLSLLQRIEIAIDVGNALDYLHHQCGKSIIHCDLKPSNVLLDKDMVTHIGDFGLAKFLPKPENPASSSSMGFRGTVGYAAPEYGLGNEVSTGGDVYSYGILLLEMTTGKRPTSEIFTGDENLHKFCRLALPGKVLEIADPFLLQEDEPKINGNDGSSSQIIRAGSKVECLTSMIKVGVACSMVSPQDRMDIRNAISELRSMKNNYMQTRTRVSKPQTS